MAMPDTTTASNVVETYTRALSARDFETARSLLADDLHYTHSSSSVDTKASLIEAITSGRSAYRKIERPQERIRVYGDSAVVAVPFGMAACHWLVWSECENNCAGNRAPLLFWKICRVVGCTSMPTFATIAALPA